ncbi:hypothetical protein GW820_04410 [archaeon]|nr:hypothetical protein [archaeon]
MSVKDYCIYFLNIFNQDYSIWSLEKLEKEIKKANGDLFPESINLYNYFHDGNYEFVANFIYSFPNIKKEWLMSNTNYLELDEIEIYKTIFDKNSEDFIFSKLMFNQEKMLCDDSINKIITYLFILFLPGINSDEFLFHFKKNKPLICCVNVSNKSFDTLLEITTEYIKKNNFTYDKNLNHLLVGDFMTIANELHDFNEETKWTEILPIYKINKFFDLNYGFLNISDTIDKKIMILFENLPTILLFIEKEYSYLKLKKELSSSDKKEKIQKI